MKRTGSFSRLSRSSSRTAGHPASFAIAFGVVAAWALTGPMFHFSDTWQLVINTSTTIVTFLMVFLIQNTQNRDSEAMQLKLDELLRATKYAHNGLLDIEELTEQDLDQLKSAYAELATKAREDLRRGLRDTGSPQVKPKFQE